MRPILTGTAVAIFALTASIGTAVPAGVPEVFRVRTVTMNGVSGPAYYSHATRSYRFLGPIETGDVASLQVER